MVKVGNFQLAENEDIYEHVVEYVSPCKCLVRKFILSVYFISKICSTAILAAMNSVEAEDLGGASGSGENA